MDLLFIDTERIHGNDIYLFSYQLYDENFKLIDSKTFRNLSIDLSTRKSPKTKVEKLKNITINCEDFPMIFNKVKHMLKTSKVIMFSKTDIGAIKNNCKSCNIEMEKFEYIDVQEALVSLSTDEKHKSNLKDYAKKHHIKHNPHIPESDCYATMCLYRNLINGFGEEFLEKFKHI